MNPGCKREGCHYVAKEAKKARIGDSGDRQQHCSLSLSPSLSLSLSLSRFLLDRNLVEDGEDIRLEGRFRARV